MTYAGVGVALVIALALARETYPPFRRWWDGLWTRTPQPPADEAKVKATMRVELRATIKVHAIVGALVVAAAGIVLYWGMPPGG